MGIRSQTLRIEDFPQEHQEWLEPLLRAFNDLNTDSSTAISKGLTFKDNFNGFLKELVVTPKDDWKALQLSSPWRNADQISAVPASYRKKDGLVYMIGEIVGGTSSETLAVTVLEKTCWPAVDCSFTLEEHDANGTNHSTSYMSVEPDGRIFMHSVQNSAKHQAINVSWAAADPVDLPNPVFPITFRNELKGGKAPAGVLIMAAQDITASNKPPVSLPALPAWKVNKDSIQILDIKGLAPKHTYKLTLLVLGG